MSMLFKRIKDWATSITAFRAGDVIPVDGPSGTAKMSKDALLALVAQPNGTYPDMTVGSSTNLSPGGTSGQYLKSNGSGNAPSWDDTSNLVSGETRRLFGVRKSLTGGTYAALIKVTVLDSANYAYSGAIFSFTTRTQNKQNVKGIVTVSAFEYNEASTIVCRTLVLDSKVITNDSSIPQFYVRQTYDNNKWVYELWVKANADCAISVNVVNDSRNFLETMSDTSSTYPARLTECDLYSNVMAKCTSNTVNNSKVGGTSIPVYVDTDGSVKECNIRFIPVSGSWTAPNVSGDAKFTLYNSTGSSVSLTAGSLSKTLLEGEYCDLFAVNGTWKKFSYSYT